MIVADFSSTPMQEHLPGIRTAPDLVNPLKTLVLPTDSALPRPHLRRNNGTEPGNSWQKKDLERLLKIDWVLGTESATVRVGLRPPKRNENWRGHRIVATGAARSS